MQRSSFIDWQQFLFYLSPRGNCPELCIERLHTPLSIRWPETESELSFALNKVMADIPPSLNGLLKLSLLASSLLPENTALKPFVEKWLTDEGDARHLLAPASLDDIFRGNWRTVPVVIVQGKKSNTVWFLVGVILNTTIKEDMPGWAADLLDRKALDAVKDAFSAARFTTAINRHLFTFPLTMPSRELPIAVPGAKPPIAGRSLGLPLGIGGVSALIDSDLPGKWLATGDLKPNGETAKVNSIPAKFRHALADDFTLFLFPLENTLLASKKYIEAIGVNSLRIAWLWVTRHAPGNAEEIRRLEIAMQNPADFVANCSGLSAATLAFYRQSPLTREIIGQVKNKDNLISKFTAGIEESMKCAGYEHAEELANFYSTDDDLRAIGEVDAVAALSLCSSHLALENHSGNRQKEDLWFERGLNFVDQALKRKDGHRIYSRFINRRHGVSDRHNRYDFQIDLPEEFMNVLDLQKKRNELDNGCADYALGSLYGTMAQNYAFCGPDHLQETRKYLAAAQKAFGDGHDRELQFHWVRQISYLFFALIDAKCFGEAGSTLEEYLDLCNWPEQAKSDQPADGFPFYAATRYLADCPDPIPNSCGQWEKDILNQFQEQRFPTVFRSPYDIHPWQLWHYNVGRLALRRNKPDIAQQAWQWSIKLCEQGGETMQVMALLPLAALHDLKSPMQEHLEKCEHILYLIRNSDVLNKKHFQDLLVAYGPEQALGVVTSKKGKLFPFNYR